MKMTSLIFPRSIPGRKFHLTEKIFQDVDRWPHLNGVFIPQVDTETGLLIASDVPEALDPIEVKHSQNGGPYASRTCNGWAINGTLGRRRNRSQSKSASFLVSVAPQLHRMVEDFYNRDFTDCFVDDTTEMSHDALRFMQNAKRIQLKDGHCQIPLPLKDHVVSVTWLKKNWRTILGCMTITVRS